MKTRIAGLVAAALVLGVAQAASAQAVLHVGKAQDTPFDFVPPDVALAKGIFKANGIHVELSSFAGSAKLQQAMAAGAMDIGLGSGPELAFVAKGSPELAVAAFAGPPDGLVLVVRKDGPIHTVADLKGTTISVSSVGSLTEWVVRETSRQQGWGPDGINIVFLGDIIGQIAALKTKQTDGMSNDIASATHLEQDNIGRIVLSFGKIAPDFIIHATFATNEIMQKRPDQLRAFLKAWFETIAWMRKNKDETVKIVMPVMHQPQDVVERAYDVVMPTFSDTGKFEPKALAVLSRSFEQMNLLPSGTDLSKTYTEKFLPGAP